MNKVVNIINRVPVLYIAVAVIIALLFDVGSTLNISRLKTLNRLRYPDITEVTVFADNPERGDLERLEKHWFYYKKVAEFLPEQTDHIGLWGFCSYYLGKNKEAVRAYELAIKKAPGFFWFHHNLGIIYFHQGNYVKAVEHFNKAINSDLNISIQFILASKRLYLPLILSQAKDIQSKIQEDLRQGYVDIYKYLIKSYEAQEDYYQMGETARIAIARFNPQDGFFYYYAGVASVYLNQYPQALAFLKRAGELSPESPEVFSQLALLVDMTGNKDLALNFKKQENLLTQAGIKSAMNIDSIQLKPY